jgi:hypothetical protein
MKKKILALTAMFILGAIVYSTASFFVEKYAQVKRPVIQSLLPAGYDSASIADLYAVGFKNAKNIELYEAYKTRKKYMDEYHIMYMTDTQVKQLLSDNNFILGDADRFTGTIPKFAIDSIVSKVKQVGDNRSIYELFLPHNNLQFDLYSDEMNKVPVSGHANWDAYYGTLFGNFIKQSAIAKHKIPASDFWQINLKKQSNTRVVIIAGANQFDITGMQVVQGILSLPVPKDPIALLQVPGGYVELVNWK